MTIKQQLDQIFQELRVLRARLEAVEQPNRVPPPRDSLAHAKEMVLRGLD